MLTNPAFIAATELDRLLEAVCVALQITPDQQARAEAEYHKVTLWLSRQGGPLSQFRLELFPQGSAAIGATVRPRQADGNGDRREHDVDLVCQIAWEGTDPMQLYRGIRDDLLANPALRPLVREKTRCLRLDYPGQFHLDVLPARPVSHDPRDTRVEIPDRELRCFMPSNPRGYVEWYCAQAATWQRQARGTAPLPPPEPVHAKPALTLAVQLLKRRRSVAFAGRANAPRSIVLTTLAGIFYDGEPTVTRALSGILTRLDNAITSAAPRSISVVNPANPDECLSEAWLKDPAAYDAFVRFVRSVRRELAALPALQGVEPIAQQLRLMFGEDMVNDGVRRYTERLTDARGRNAARFTPTGLITTGTAGVRVPSNRFYGR